MTRRDIALSLLALSIFFAAHAVVGALDKPVEEPEEIVAAAEVSQPAPLVFAAVEVSQPEDETLHNPTPLPDELYSALLDACEANTVPVELALAVMEQESGFDQEAISPSGCYGLMQLNPRFFPADLAPGDNIRAGVGYLGELLGRYAETPQAVTAYFYGPSSRTSSWYSDEVLERVARWEA